MRVLISHEGFSAFAGTEGYMLTVAEQLQRTGHTAIVCAPELGAIAEFARTRGVDIRSMRDLPPECDLILAQDAGTCLELSSRYPGARIIFVAHSTIHMLQTPPQLPDVYDALVVLNERTLRWARGLGHTERLVRLRQPIDLIRARTVAPRQVGRPRMLVLSGYQFGSRFAQLKRAGDQAGVELYSLTEPTPYPEREIAAADAVIGLGRSALDAMASSRSVLVLGPLGGDGWVTTDSYAALEADGFSGQATDAVLDTDALADQLAAWQPAMGIANRDLVARHHDVRDHVAELMVLAGELVEGSTRRPRGHQDELARLVRVEWQRSGDLITARAVNNQLAAEGERLARQIAELNEQLSDTRQQLEQARAQHDGATALAADSALRYERLIATRRWRLALALARPLDLLKSLARG